jgi:hypothetical protein
MRKLSWVVLFTNWKHLLAVVLTVLFVAVVSLPAQTLTTGSLTGTVTDPSGAVVPNAPVAARNVGMGGVLNTTTNSAGSYQFTLLKPGSYVVTVEVTGFAKVEQSVTVNVGQQTTADFSLSVKTSVQTIEVTGAPPIVSTNASPVTTFLQVEIAQLPSPGNDITNIALSSPGTVMNSMGGYGNFTSFGLPATSNLFTVNGENDMDPYFNINNTGATNLTLGSNEIAEVSVTSNPYAGEYGQLAGAQVSMITKSGSNQFHGNAQYWWNGSVMNANDWMLKNSDTPRAFSNNNQWAASIGGPIRKDSTFFFVDTEGLRFILPNSFSNTIPTPAFAAAVLSNVAALRPNESAAFQKLFQLYASSPGASAAVPRTVDTDPADADPCFLLSFSAEVSWTPGTPCFAAASGSAGLLGTEWILAFRVDQRVGKNDNLYFRYKLDKGLQPTYLDPINTNFNALSKQPSYDAQINETHVFGPRSTNSFMATASHYVAQFQQDEAKALGTFPYAMSFGGSSAFTGFGLQYDFPQGRNITQYQFIDDFTLIRGKHSFKFGENFRRYDVSDHNFFYNNPRVAATSLQEFADGLFLYYRKADNFASNVPIAMWGLGLYAQDEWSVRSNLKLTLGIRAERNSNPVCQTNCFANFIGPFGSLPSFAAGTNAGSIPYNQDIKTGQHQAYPGVDFLDWAPRIGFSWAPRSSKSLVLSGGFGIFYDNPPASVVDDLLANPPIATRITVSPTGGTPAFDTTAAGSAATWAASANAFSTGFANGQTFSQIRAALLPLGVTFSPPAFTSIVGTIHAPLWEEWNIQVQKSFGTSSSLTVNYVGNHGSRLLYGNPWLNTYDPLNETCTSPNPDGSCPEGDDVLYQLFQGKLPLTAPVPNYGAVTECQTGAISNYNGVTFSFKERYKSWLLFQLNYTYSHNLDEVSNGGVSPYNTSGFNDSILTQLNPSGIAANYGNSDYDVRHLISANYVIDPEFHVSGTFARHALNGWQFAGKAYWRTGLPFSVTDGNWTGALKNGGETIMAQPIGGVAGQTSCGRGNATGTQDTTVPGCLNAAGFIDSGADAFVGYSTFPVQERNQYRGPHYFNVDMSLFKNFSVHENLKFGVGIQAFNVFNHPNFFIPNPIMAHGDTTFGQISAMTPTPTSPYGAFFGFDSSPRVVQLSAKINF